MEFTIRKDCKTYPHKKHWQYCVGSGHALLALRTDYTRQLRFIHEELGVRYVRFHGIFCDDMNTVHTLADMMPFPGAEQFTEQSFHACGVAYDNVLEAGMKPFVELSFMPRHLAARDDRGMFFYKPCISPPADYEVWAEYIRSFVRFLEHRYGAEEVRTWPFEVWNEPDLPVFFSGTRDDYFKLYEVTARAIKSVDEKIRVGGPSTSGSRWVRSFMDFCEKNQVPVDFVSTHQYAGDPLGGVEDQGDMESGKAPDFHFEMPDLSAIKEKTFLAGQRGIMPDQSEARDIPNDIFINNAPIVKQQAKGLPVYYTEWNENAGFASYTNDTRKVAAYDVKTALDVAEHVDGSSIWCFSDIFEELHPFPQQFHGGFGMLTQDGVPKPVFYGMKMLAMAGEERLDLGEGATKGEIGIAAFRRTGTVQALLFRQKMKNLDLPKEEAVVRVECPRKPGQVTVCRVDEEHCNPLKVWEDMGRPQDMNRQEVEALKEKTAMVREPWPFTWENGVLTVAAQLGVNDLYLIEIEM